MAETFYIIDGHATGYRAYFATENARLSATDGTPTGAVHVFLNILQKLIRERNPAYLVTVFDGPGPTFRHEMYPEYKATRPGMPDDLRTQMGLIQDICRGYRIPVIIEEGIEADDAMAVLAARAVEAGLHAVLVTGDKDAFQLVDNGRVHVYDPMKEIEFDEEAVLEARGVRPHQMVDLLALMGDSSDNIPGVKGVGPKKAAQLLKKYGSLDAVLDAAQEQTPKLKENLTLGRDDALRSRDLVRLRTDSDIDCPLEACRRQHPDVETLLPLFQRLGLVNHLKALLSNHGPAVEVGEESPTYHAVDTPEKLESFLKQLREQSVFAFDTETTSQRATECEPCGCSFSWRVGEGWYVPTYAGHAPDLDPQQTLEALRPILEDPKVGKVGQNIKYDQIVLRSAGINLRGVVFDTMLAAFLAVPGATNYGLDQLALQYLGRKTIPIEDLIGRKPKQVCMTDVPLDKVAQYAGEDAEVTWALYEILSKRLDALDLTRLNAELEVPLIDVLAEMEYNGIRVDASMLREMGEDLAGLVEETEEQIYEHAGRRFTIGSVKQLQEVLFDELQLPVVRKTKTGRSTDEQTLRRLAEQHLLPGLILEYRELTKLKSTYVDALPSFINDRTGRIHCSFNQTGAETGRLSSSSPNLQQIPARTAMGRAIRGCFLPGGEDQRLIGCDYSQIELRMLAHYSGDEILRRTFDEGEDIHRAVAATLNGVSPDAVTPEMRSRAKAVNFGIIYGQGAFGLSQTTGMRRSEAQAFIDAYFERLPGVRACLDDIREQARDQGFVSTILGRRRYIPDINSGRVPARRAAERAAVNAVFQGSAADLLKKAMLDVHADLQKHRDAKMLLTIHDELILEASADVAEQVAQRVAGLMEKALPLKVPVKVDWSVGRNWLEAK